MANHLKVIIDYNGTLTVEETQVAALAERSLHTLANEILGVPFETLAAEYQATRTRLLRAPHRYWWEVNGGVQIISHEPYLARCPRCGAEIAADSADPELL